MDKCLGGTIGVGLRLKKTFRNMIRRSCRNSRLGGLPHFPAIPYWQRTQRSSSHSPPGALLVM
ncbi:hypothetical protein N1851_005630 [Merluccius polli]|uniref:Uncharacterized protein n=1 Tax=Merluccius polli TaxID=89951 RepID=A0AA47N6X9_MERPO|nr:hypothetical protein N1851_005630 [Merluccius polli]